MDLRSALGAQRALGEAHLARASKRTSKNTGWGHSPLSARACGLAPAAVGVGGSHAPAAQTPLVVDWGGGLSLATGMQACKSEASKNTAKRAPKLHKFSHFFLPIRGGWWSCDFVAPQAGSTALGIHGADSTALKVVSRIGADRDRTDRQY
jgi:hypothetical protein